MLNQVANWSYFEYIDWTLSKSTSPKLARNATAGFHAIVSTAMAGMCMLAGQNGFDSIYNYTKLFSTGFFLYDINYILRKEKLSLTRCALLYHHIVTINYLYQDPRVYFGYKAIFWGEMSNIPSYFVYYYLQKNMTDSHKFKIWSKIQKILYTGIRLPFIGSLIYTTHNSLGDASKTPVALMAPIYIMGLVWSLKLLKQNY